ncbi:metalloregulator ArsR/SmtB family transcription factor [Nonomuraea sp. NPDC050328]|uniref:metalloregulator ArsR/SmtB family transcription factor n=1 Tax=Nonomuraea sp. NPDC050328 TaxID=3364361 RepID=UPI003799EBE0
MDDALRAVADPTRRAILLLVRDGEVSAGEIAGRFPGMSRPAVSQHLRTLVAAGLVEMRRAGNRRFYRLRPEGLADAVSFVDGMWSAALGRLRQAAEQEAEQEAEREEREGGVVTEQRVRIQAQPETVWRFLVDPARLAAWWGEAEVDARPGGDLRVAMEGGPRPVMRGQFVELVPYERLVFTFGWEPTPGAPDLAPGASQVEITLVAEDGGTTLTLRHTGLPAVLEGETGAGWAHLLRRLGSAAR